MIEAVLDGRWHLAFDMYLFDLWYWMVLLFVNLSDDYSDATAEWHVFLATVPII